MRNLIGVAVLVCMISTLGLAQEPPKPEVYGGYQFTSTDGGWHASGWNTAANMYITRWLGATADFSGRGRAMEIDVQRAGPAYSFTGQVALVTGASSGMGLATAQAFAAAGAAVVMADINRTALLTAHDALVSAGHHRNSNLMVRCVRQGGY